MSTLEILINAQDNASSKLDDVGNSLDRLGSKTGGIESSFVNLQKTISVGVIGAVTALGASIAGLTSVVTDGVGKAADMEQGVADIAAVMGIASDEVAPLKKLIGDLGMDPTLKVNATEAADAIMQLAQSGISMSDIIDGAAKNVVLLSNATGGDMALSAAIASDAMSLFNMSATDMEKAVNQITGVTIASKFGIEDYKHALANVGGVASSVGLSFTDMNTTIAAIAPSFASGQEAGTSLKTLLSRMVPASQEAADAMREIGLFSGMTSDEMERAQKEAKKLQAKIAALDPASKDYAEKSALLNQQLQNVNASMVSGQNAFFNADGSMKSMSEIAGILQNALSGLSDEQKASTLTTIFSSDAIRAATALARIGSEEFDNLAASIGEVDAGQSAATRMNTFSGTMEILAGIVDSLSIQIGDAFLPVLRNLAQWAINFATQNGPAIIGLFQQLAGVLDFVLGYFTATIESGTLMNERFEQLPGAIQPIVEFVSSLATALSNLLIQQEYWKDILIALGIVLTTIIAPAIVSFLAAFLPIAALFAGIIVVVRQLRENFDSQFGAIFDNLSQLAQLVFAWTSAMLTGWVSVEMGLSAIGDAFRIHLGRAYEQFLILFNGILAWISENLPAWVATLQSWATAVWQWLVDVVPVVLEKIGSWGAALIGWVSANLPAWVATFQSWATAVWQWLVDVVPVVLEKIGSWGAALIGWVSTNLPAWVATFQSWATAVWQWLVDVVPVVIEKISAWGAALIGWVSTNLPAWVATFQSWATAIWQWLVDVTPIAVEKIGAWGAALIGWVSENHSTWASSFTDWSAATWQWIVDAIPIGTGKLIEWAETFYGWLGENLPDWIEAFLDWSLAMVEWIGEAIPKAIRAIGNFVQGISDTGAEEGESQFPGLVSGWAGALINWITNDLIPQVGPKFLLLMQEYARTMLIIAVELGKLAVVLAVALWKWIVDVTPIAIAKLREWGAALFQWITDNLPEWIKKLKEWAKAAWEWLVEVTPIAIEKLKEWGGALRAWIIENLPEWIKKLKEWGIAAWEWLVEVTPIVIEKLKEWRDLLVEYVKENLPNWIENLQEWGTAIWEWLVEFTPIAIEKLKEWSSLLIGYLADKLPEWLAEIYKWGRAVVEWLAEALPDALNAITDFIQNLSTAGEVEGEKSFIDMVKEWGATLIATVGPELAKFALEVVRLIGNLALELMRLGATLGISLILGLAEGLLDLVGIKVNLDEVKQTMFDTLNAGIDKAKSVGNNLIKAVQDGLSGDDAGLQKVAGNVWTVLDNEFKLSTRLDEATAWGRSFIHSMNKGLSNQAATITTAIQSAWTTIDNEFKLTDRLASATSWGKSFIDKMNAGLSGQATTITTAIQSAWTTISTEFELPSRLTQAYDWGKNVLGKLSNGISEFSISSITDKAADIWNAFKDKLTWDGFVNIGNVIMDALHQGIVVDKIAWLTGEIARGMQAIVDAVKRIFNIDSPSKVMLDIGANLMIGMERGISNNIPEVIKATQSMADGVMSVANGMSLSPSMALSTSPLGYASTGNIIRPSVTNNATYNLNYQTMQSAGSVQQDVELLNLLYGGAL